MRTPTLQVHQVRNFAWSLHFSDQSYTTANDEMFSAWLMSSPHSKFHSSLNIRSLNARLLNINGSISPVNVFFQNLSKTTVTSWPPSNTIGQISVRCRCSVGDLLAVICRIFWNRSDRRPTFYTRLQSAGSLTAIFSRILISLLSMFDVINFETRLFDCTSLGLLRLQRIFVISIWRWLYAYTTMLDVSVSKLSWSTRSALPLSIYS